MFKFIGSIIEEMKLTTWPSRKQSVRDFFMVIEYTAFFLVFIIIFDWVTQHGITFSVNHLIPFLKSINLSVLTDFSFLILLKVLLIQDKYDIIISSDKGLALFLVPKLLTDFCQLGF